MLILTNMKQLFLLLDKIQVLKPALRKYIESCIIETKVKKKTIILRPGEVNRRVIFIVKGLVRSFRLEGDREKTSWAFGGGNIILSVGSFFSQKPATEFLQTLEDSVFLSITYQQFAEICRKFPQFHLHWAVLVTRYYELSDDRE